MAGNQVRIGVGVKDDATKPIKGIQDAFQRLQKDGAKGFAIGAGAAVTAKALTLVNGALSGVVQGAFDSIQAASSLNEAMSKSDAVFKDGSASMKRWAAGASDAFGQSQRQALEAAGTFGNLIQAFGIGAPKAQEMSKAMTELASDLASFNNTSVDEAIEALRSGLSGETEPLKRYGVALSDVRLKEEALRLGLIKTTSGVLPIAIKTQAAYSLILRDTSLAQGDFKRTADGLANTQKTITAQMEDASAEIGEKLLPLALDLANAFKNEVIPAISGFASVLGILSGEMPKTQEDVSDLLHLVGMFNPAARAAAKGMDEAADDMASSTSRVADAVRSRSGEMQGDLKQTALAFGKLGDRAAVSAEVVTLSMTDMADGLRDLARAHQKAAKDIIGDYYDPIEAKNERAALKREASEQRQIIASKESTKAQIKDAKKRLFEIERASLELLVTLASTGKATVKELNTATTSWQRKWHKAGAAVGTDLWKIIRQLQLLKLAAIQASDAWKNLGGLAGGGRGRHAGGPVSAREPYIVGEKGPELFVPGASGTIVPHDKLTTPTNWQRTRTTGGGTSGAPAAVSMVFQFSFPGMLIAPTQAQAHEIGRIVGPAVAEHLRNRGLIPR